MARHEKPKKRDDRLRPLKMDLPLAEALRGALSVPPPEDDEEQEQTAEDEADDEERTESSS